MKILITGPRGFLGSNMVRLLQQQANHAILLYDKHMPLSELHTLLDNADCIFHFAGEVRPYADDSSFIQNNTQLTRDITDYLIQQHATTPLLMVSSVHAAHPKNIYGHTKRDAELALEQYLAQGGRTIIYRLPHVFGEGAKPNHNSAITTWIYNSIHQLPITVYDRSIPITYCYVQEVVQELANALLHTTQEGYLAMPITYPTTLGDVVDAIQDIAQHVERSDSFYHKLKHTYRYYLSQAKSQALHD